MSSLQLFSKSLLTLSQLFNDQEMMQTSDEVMHIQSH